MFFPTGKLIGSSRLLHCWLEARWEEGIPKPAQGYQCGGKVSSPICQMEHVKGQPAERGRQRAWKAKHSQECPVSPRKKKTTTKNQMKLQTVCNGITLICRGRAGGAALTVIYWVVSTNIWEWLEPKCQLLNSGAEHEAGSGPGPGWAAVRFPWTNVELRLLSFLWGRALQRTAMGASDNEKYLKNNVNSIGQSCIQLKISWRTLVFLFLFVSPCFLF